MKTVVIFSLLIIGLFVQFPVVQGEFLRIDIMCSRTSDTCEPPNYCWRGICIHQARHLVDEEIFVPAASKGVSAFDGESCAKCHYPNQCIDRRCVPRGVERHLVNTCTYGADCGGRGPWFCLDAKCINWSDLGIELARYRTVSK
uniref:Uncharacterized protein n=1 Tax=Caenorhabditis japonica TaxID=281687 RepID=A0A8R1I3Z7_CAEJA